MMTRRAGGNTYGVLLASLVEATQSPLITVMPPTAAALHTSKTSTLQREGAYTATEQCGLAINISDRSLFFLTDAMRVLGLHDKVSLHGGST